MNETSAFSEYVSVERVPFVDRREVLQQIHGAMRAASPERPPVFFIKAPGGMGKTELLREVLRRCRSGEWDGQRWAAANDAIDFYHLGTHTVEGLSSAIHDALQPGPSFFINFRSRLRDLKERRSHIVGLPQPVSDALRDLVGRALIEDLNAMAHVRPAVLALDTAERLLYEPDEVQKALGMEDIGVAVLPWLLREFLPKVHNVFVILAGRPEPETPARLFEDLRQSVGERLHVIELAAFSLEDALEYWEAASRAAEEERPDLAAWLRAIGPDRRRVIHRYTGGRPILLSLTLDYLLRADQLPDDLKEPEEVAVAKTGEELARVQDRLEERLVKEFQERGLPADPAIRMLGLAQRGVDCELLGRLLGKSDAEAKQVFETLRRLSFIKVRPADQRLFLHDEMYQLLWKHVLQFDEVGRARAFAAILGYYKEKIEEASRSLRRASTDVDLQADLYRLKAEEVHYRLRHEPWQGFQTYYYYSKEAYWAHDEPGSLELRDELLEFLGEFDRWTLSGSLLQRAHIACDSALRWVDRAGQRNYEDAVKLVVKVRSTPSLIEIFAQAGVLAQAELDALEGRAQIYLGRHLDKAGELLDKAREAVGRFQPEPDDDLSSWRKQALLAEIYNDLGYLARVRGQLEDSVAFYREAIVCWRQLGAPAEPLHANTLNNLSWALAERGRYQDALRFCLDGLELRQERGYRGPIAFSLNTLGLIEVRNDQPERAIHHCEQALSIFRDLAQPRGVGLACIALAEANRRSATSPAAPALDEQVKLLDRAVSLAGEAVAIFREQVPERERLVEALIELGCAYRDWMRIRGLEGYPNDQDPPPAALLSDGQKAFEEAIAQAQDAFAHRAVDAQVNLAWLHFYAGELPRAEETASAVLARPEVQPYLIRKDRGLPDVARPQPFFWTQLGKLHLLLGRIAMKWHETAGREKQIAPIRDAAEHFTLALAYDYQFADDFRDLRRGKEAIYNALKGFNLQYEFPTFVRGMEEAVNKYRLPQPTHLQRFVEEAFGPLAQLGAGR